MGHAGGPNLSVVPECGSCHVGAQIFPSILPVEVAPAGAAEATGHGQSGLPGVGSAGQRPGSVPPDADHYAGLSAAKFHIQRVQLDAEGHAERVQPRYADYRRNYAK